MLTEYLAIAIHEERRSELAKCRLGAEAARLNGHRSWLSKIGQGRRQARASRERSAASAAGHSLSTIE